MVGLTLFHFALSQSFWMWTGDFTIY